MNLFYTSSFDENMAWVTDEEARHMHKVFRHREGDEVLLTDGKGLRIEGVIEQITKKDIRCKIVKQEYLDTARSYRLEIAIAPTKNMSRIEWLLEKGVEIGLDRMVFLHCDHSERSKIRLDRLERIAWSALKQSQQFHLPDLLGIQSFKDYVAQVDQAAQQYLAHLSEQSQPFRSLASAKGHIRILIGPEGDFSNEEIEWALQHNWVPCTLGHTRLRTETAAISAIAWTAFLNEYTQE